MAQGDADTATLPTLEQMQQWTQVIGRAQQMMLERASGLIGEMPTHGLPFAAPAFDPEVVSDIQADFAKEGMALWQRFLDGGGFMGGVPSATTDAPVTPIAPPADRRFVDPAWADHPLFDLIRQSYLLLSDYLLRLSDAVDGIDPRQKAQLRFATRGLIDAASPSNFPFTNPKVLEKTLETGGENLLTGLQRMLADIEKGQLTQVDASRFEVGRNLAATPGKVIHETPLYQLIQYSPTTESVFKTPLVIFPPWINRFYILDLSPQKSLVKWAVDNGVTVFMVSWKSADADMKDVS